MKNLQEMSLQEMRETEGGLFFECLLIAAFLTLILLVVSHGDHL